MSKLLSSLVFSLALSCCNFALSQTSYQVVFEVEATHEIGKQEPVQEHTRLELDFQVTGEGDEMVYVLRRTKKIADHAFQKGGGEFSYESVSQFRNGKETKWNYDEISPDLKELLTDLFGHPLCTTKIGADGEQTIIPTEREAASRELKSQTHLFLTLMPMKREHVELLSVVGERSSSRRMARVLPLDPTMKMMAMLDLELKPSEETTKNTVFDISGGGTLKRAETTRKPKTELSPAKGRIEFDSSDGQLKSAELEVKLMLSRDEIDLKSVTAFAMTVARLPTEPQAENP